MSLLFCLIYNVSSFSSVYSADKTYSWGPKRHTLALPALVLQLKISDEVMWRTLLYLHSGKLQPRHCLPACLQCWIWAKWPKGNFTAIFFSWLRSRERWWENTTIQRQGTEYQNPNTHGHDVRHSQSWFPKKGEYDMISTVNHCRC